jgi:hypothetical protein
MKKIKDFIATIYEQTKVEIEWETFTRGGKFEFSILHVIAILAIIIYIWTR